MGGSGSKRLVSTMTIGGDTSEVVEDDNILVVSDNRGNEEVNSNGNMWPKFGVQVQSYYRNLSICKRMSSKI